MPYYYSDFLTQVTVTTSVTQQLGLITLANQAPCAITSSYAEANSNTAGGIIIRLQRFSAIFTAGTAQTPTPRNPRHPAAQTSASTLPTAGTAGVIQQTYGCPQTGGTGGWLTTDPDDWIYLSPNGGANGNITLATLATATGQTMDATLIFNEAA